MRARCWKFLKIDETIQSPSSSLSLTPLELDIMKAVWRRSPITVRDVQLAILPTRRLAYTTVMTILYRLYLKGFVRRELKSKAHYYVPAVGFAAVRDAAVSGVIDHFFKGSREEFLQFLGADLGTSREVASPAALDEALL